jgi:hypothetical protein
MAPRGHAPISLQLLGHSAGRVETCYKAFPPDFNPLNRLTRDSYTSSYSTTNWSS